MHCSNLTLAFLFLINLLQHHSILAQLDDPTNGPNPRIAIISKDQFKDVGNTAYFSCSVENAESNTVTWVRYPMNRQTDKSYTVLATGDQVLVSDDRVNVKNAKNSLANYFSLQVRNVQAGDAGTYLCYLTPNVGATTDLLVRSPPVFPENFLNSVGVTEGESGELNCFANGYPKPTVFWGRTEDFKAEESIAYGNTYTIALAKKDTVGRYYCMAMNTLGEDRRHIDVMVRYPPSFYGNSSSKVDIVEGQSAVITCEAEGYPTPTICWGRSEKFSPEQNIGTGNVYPLSNVEKVSSGRYYCLALNIMGERRRSVDVEVTWPPVFYDNSSNTLLITEGKSGELACYADASPTARIFWSRDENFTLATILAEGNFFSIESATKDTRGRYYCLALNSLGKIKRSVDVEVTFPPVFYDNSSIAVLIKAGEAGELTCQVEGNPLPTVFWSRDENFTAITEGSVYSIQNATKSTKGRYYCLARNSLGETRRSMVVEVTWPPVFHDNSTNTLLITEGESGELACFADANPPANVFWSRDENFTVASGKGSIYPIKTATKDTKGRYYCLAGNTLGAIQRSIDVEVEFAPQITVPVTITGQSPGGNAHLECLVTGHPPPVVTWGKRGGVNITNDEHHKLMSRGNRTQDDSFTNATLEISALKEEHFEIYTCTARNKIGSSFGRITLLKNEFFGYTGEILSDGANRTFGIIESVNTTINTTTPTISLSTPSSTSVTPTTTLYTQSSTSLSSTTLLTTLSTSATPIINSSPPIILSTQPSTFSTSSVTNSSTPPLLESATKPSVVWISNPGTSNASYIEKQTQQFPPRLNVLVQIQKRQ